ncbi:MAG: secondary thiamine-phosphate synthase enzyme YjbQ [Gammaproteobacteria bacterium]|jgi:secondary thiamine-phosphate synthase enzyme|nr:secondary thiamine-phosphate synthase enzyme YjbQ [Gammaproteobacteria bacterium]
MSSTGLVWAQRVLTVATPGRGSYDITREVDAVLSEQGVEVGTCHVFVRHTSASLMICENADPDVRRDLELLMARLAPDADPAYRHTAEGPDDMAAHMRAVVTHTDLTVPVSRGRCALGTWQGIYLWEHRTAPQRRQITVTVQGRAGD